MADFANYTPGEYAKKHIRITPTTLADGRDFFYLDDDPEFVSGAKTRELKDPRPLDYRFAPHLDADGNEVPYAAPQMRRDPLTGAPAPISDEQRAETGVDYDPTRTKTNLRSVYRLSSALDASQCAFGFGRRFFACVDSFSQTDSAS